MGNGASLCFLIQKPFWWQCVLGFDGMFSVWVSVWLANWKHFHNPKLSQWKYQSSGNNLSMYVCVCVCVCDGSLGLILSSTAHSVSIPAELWSTHMVYRGCAFCDWALNAVLFDFQRIQFVPGQITYAFLCNSVSSQIFLSNPVSFFPSKKECETILRSPCIAVKKLLIIYVCI